MRDISKLMLLEKEDKSKRSLPPRTEDVKIIANVLKRKPIKVSNVFCIMCDSQVHNTWILNTSIPFELRHLADVGSLRDSELKILIDALEKGELTYHWLLSPLYKVKDHLFKLKNIIYYNFIEFIQFCHKEFKIFCRKIRVWNVLSSRNKWYLSKNRNLYNPVFQATIYPWNGEYNIARFCAHHEGFPTQVYAKKVAFKMWFKDKFNKDYLTESRPVYSARNELNPSLLLEPKATYSEVIIRYATDKDISEFLPLMSQLGYPATQQELEKRFESFTKLNGDGIAVACMNNKVIGWVAWSKSSLFVSDKTRFHIEGLVVDENYRKYGVGKKLMLFVEEYAKQFSPVIIDLTSGMRRAGDGTHEFYQKLGYQNEGYMAKLYLRKEI